MRKPALCINAKNKGAYQLRGNCAAEQCLCFCFIDETISLHHTPTTASLLISPLVVQLSLCRTPRRHDFHDAAPVLLCVQKCTNRQNSTHTRPYEKGSSVKITNVSIRMAFIQISFSH